jgi:hypothetical protein
MQIQLNMSFVESYTAPMNTTRIPQTRTLAAGQALAVRAKRLILVEGELLVQAPAQWLGDTVAFAPATHVAAPAALVLDGTLSVRALGGVRIVIEQPAGVLASLGIAWARFARACSRVAAQFHPPLRHN